MDIMRQSSSDYGLYLWFPLLLHDGWPVTQMTALT